MVHVPTIVGFGNSNWEGIAPLSNLPAAYITLWTGGGAVTPLKTYNSSTPGVRILTPRMPYTPDVEPLRTITASAANSVTASTNWTGTNDQWVYIADATAGQGQHRRITAGLGTATITISPNWTVNPGAPGSGQVLGGSHTVAAGTTTTTLIKSATTAAFVAGDVGKWVVFIHGTQAGAARRIATFVSATQVTLDIALGAAPVANDGFCVLSGASAVNGLTDLVAANCELRDLTIFYDNAYPYRTGFDFPNFRHYPRTGPIQHITNQQINVVPELSWRMRSMFKEKIHVVTLGIPASTLVPSNIGTLLASGQFSWARDITHLDFHPASTNGLYQALTQQITAAGNLIAAEGNTMDVVGIFGIPCENDAVVQQAAAVFEDNLRNVRDSLRKFIADSGYSRRKAHQIPFGVSKLRAAFFAYGSVTNAAVDALAAQDSRTFGVPTEDVQYIVGDGTHFDALGMVTLGGLFFDAWKAIYEADNYTDRTIADLPTLAVLRTKVRRRWERGTSSNDASQNQIDMFLNDSLREIANTLGDNAWFLRRSEAATVETGLFPGTISLAGNIARILRIETAACPGLALTWKGIAYTSALRVQITLHDAPGGPYIVHFIQLPPELVADTDIAILPGQYIELLVALTCKRLAECVSSAPLASYYAAETERLWRYVKRDCLRYDRMRQESMTTTGYNTLRNGTFMSEMWSL